MSPLADLVLDYFRGMGCSSVEQCRRALGITDKQTLDTQMALLVRKGALRESAGMGITGVVYEFVRDPDPLRPQELLEKAWRAMRLSKVFSIWDIAMYSGASLDYCKRYIRELNKQGVLDVLGRDEKKRFRYRIKPGMDQNRAPYVRMGMNRTERAIQEAMSAGWKMMRELKAGDVIAARNSLMAVEALLRKECLK